MSVAYAILAVVLLHPWFSDPTRSVATLGPGGGGVEAADVNLVMWILAWDWHALTTDPLNLFNANIFHPAPNALAASEHLLGQVAIFGPVYGLFGNPVLAYQANFLANLVLSGTALYALLRHWGLPASASFFGGLLYAFFPFRLRTANYPHLFAGQYAPLALLFLDRTLLRARVRDAVAFGGFLLMQMLCSYYLAYITLVAFAGYVLGGLWAGRRHLGVRGVLMAAAGALVAAAVFAAFSLPYLQFRTAGSIPDTTDLHWLKLFSAGPWWALFDPTSHFYLGIVPLLLALVGLLRAPQVAARVPWVRGGAVGVAVVCYAMALGPEIEIDGRTYSLPYRAAMDFIPGFSSMRAPRRFVLMAGLGFAALSCMGLAWILPRVRRRFGARAAVALTVLVVLTTMAEYGMLTDIRRTRRMATGFLVPTVYRTLAVMPRGAVLEIPSHYFYGHFRGAVDVSEYMLYSTYHWQRLLDGYSGYVPPSAVVTRALVAALPDEKAFALLRRATGLRYVVVHRSRLPAAAVEGWQSPAGLRAIGEFESDVLFEVSDQVEPDLLPELIRTEPRTTTLLGVPLAPLSGEGRRATVEVSTTDLTVIGTYPIRIEVLAETEIIFVSGFPVMIDVRIANQSTSEWPALATVGEHLVTIGYRWEAMDGSLLAEDASASRLAYDLAPGESVRQRIAVVAPSPGEARLIIGLVQDGEWFPDTSEPVRLTVYGGSGSSAITARRRGGGS